MLQSSQTSDFCDNSESQFWWRKGGVPFPRQASREQTGFYSSRAWGHHPHVCTHLNYGWEEAYFLKRYIWIQGLPTWTIRPGRLWPMTPGLISHPVMRDVIGVRDTIDPDKLFSFFLSETTANMTATDGLTLLSRKILPWRLSSPSEAGTLARSSGLGWRQTRPGGRPLWTASWVLWTLLAGTASTLTGNTLETGGG